MERMERSSYLRIEAHFQMVADAGILDNVPYRARS